MPATLGNPPARLRADPAIVSVAGPRTCCPAFPGWCARAGVPFLVTPGWDSATVEIVPEFKMPLYGADPDRGDLAP
ncbi:hypothetical protein GCM10022222_32120 [Amycolatopsis ultiminotia]|uniref:Uncharacterized protein n=1 Tax=Amycolatopsis ultiminotia TaxID=543629 RepID=A0ABP6W7A7_9PSEU